MINEFQDNFQKLLKNELILEMNSKRFPFTVLNNNYIEISLNDCHNVSPVDQIFNLIKNSFLITFIYVITLYILFF